MRKSYLVLLMLVAFALSVSATKHNRYYSFQYGSNDYNAAANDREFQFTGYTYVSFLAGYQGLTSQTYKTETMVKGYDNRFAFPCRLSRTYKPDLQDRDYGQGL